MNEDGSKLEELFVDVWDGYNIRIHEDVSEPARKHAHGKLPRAYPALPGFGILSLSVRRAAALIVRDMYERNRHPFDTLVIGTPGFAGKLAKLQEDLTPKIPLHPKERESLLALVAALYRIRDKKLDDKELVGILSLPTVPNGRKLAQNTIRKYLEEAGSVRPNAKNKNKSSIDG